MAHDERPSLTEDDKSTGKKATKSRPTAEAPLAAPSETDVEPAGDAPAISAIAETNEGGTTPDDPIDDDRSQTRDETGSTKATPSVAAEPEADPITEVDASTDIEPEADPITEVDASTDIEPEADPQAEPEADPITEVDASTDIEPEADPITEVDASTDIEPAPVAAPDAEPASDPAADPTSALPEPPDGTAESATPSAPNVHTATEEPSDNDEDEDRSVRLGYASDIHMAPLPPVSFRGRLNKWGTGWLNWVLFRRRRYRATALSMLAGDFSNFQLDALAVTGDLVNLGTSEEIAIAKRWMQNIHVHIPVSVVPGNHDLYASTSVTHVLTSWREWMRDADLSATEVEEITDLVSRHRARGKQVSETDGQEVVMPQRIAPFPYVRKIRHVALIGLNTAYPTPLGMARGAISAEQLELLPDILDRTRAEGLQRVVLMHHPLVQGDNRRRLFSDLDAGDAAKLKRILTKHGCELILQGHNHTTYRAVLMGEPPLEIPALGIGSATEIHGKRAATWGLIDISKEGAISIRHRVWDKSGRRMRWNDDASRIVRRATP